MANESGMPGDVWCQVGAGIDEDTGVWFLYNGVWYEYDGTQIPDRLERIKVNGVEFHKAWFEYMEENL